MISRTGVLTRIRTFKATNYTVDTNGTDLRSDYDKYNVVEIINGSTAIDLYAYDPVAGAPVGDAVTLPAGESRTLYFGGDKCGVFAIVGSGTADVTVVEYELDIVG